MDDDWRGPDEAKPAGIALEPIRRAVGQLPPVGRRPESASALRRSGSVRSWAVGARPLAAWPFAAAGAVAGHALEPPFETGARHADERFRKRAAAAGDEPSVFHHHEERVVVLAVLFRDVLCQIGLSITLERVGQVVSHGRAQPPRRLSGQGASRLSQRPHEQHGLHDEHRCEKRDDAERDAPVEAPVPVRLHPS